MKAKSSAPATIISGGEALEAIGLQPLELRAKEGLALLNGTQATLAVGIVCFQKMKRLVDLADLAGAMSLEALKGTPQAFDQRIHQARPHAGQLRVAERFCPGFFKTAKSVSPTLIVDVCRMHTVSAVCHKCTGRSANAWNMCATLSTSNPTARRTIRWCSQIRGDVISGGNFHGQCLGLVFDFMSTSLSVLSNISERRIERLLNPEYGDLPPFLADDPGLNSGFMIAQVAAAALASETKVFAHPASVDSIPTSGNKEDHVPMAMGAVLKLSKSLRTLRRSWQSNFSARRRGWIICGRLKAGVNVEAAYQYIRERITHVSTDRVLSTDIEKMTEIMGEAEFVKLAE